MAATSGPLHCLEASRATALAAHSAASLAAAAGLREAARLLRSSEALARAATAALLCSVASAKRHGERAADDLSAGADARVSAPSANGATDSAAAGPAVRRRRKNRGKYNGRALSALMDVDPPGARSGGAAANESPPPRSAAIDESPLRAGAAIDESPPGGAAATEPPPCCGAAIEESPPRAGAAIDESPPGGGAARGLLPGGAVPSAAPSSPAASGAPTRVLGKKPSRERSLRRGSSEPPSSSALDSPSITVPPVASAVASGFAAGMTAVLTGLNSRPELVGSLVTLRSFDAASARWAVTVAASGESIRVRKQNLEPSFSAASE